MTGFLQSLSFATPLALWGLLSLPIIWWLLRFVPPRPRPVSFPPIRILLGLDPKLETPDKTPWWLLLLRLALAALLIFGVAHPALVKGDAGGSMSGNIFVLVDNGWATASTWTSRQAYLMGLLEEARGEGSVVSIATSAPEAQARPLRPVAAGDALEAAAAMQPVALPNDRAALLKSLSGLEKPDRIFWLTDGLDSGTFANDLVNALGNAPLTVVSHGAKVLPAALTQPVTKGGDVVASVVRSPDQGEQAYSVEARAANGRVLGEQTIIVPANAATAPVTFSLPTELRNEIQSLTIAGAGHAGARQLLDDRWRRKTVALQAGTTQEGAQPLLSPLHYISRALEPHAELFEPRTPEEMRPLLDQGVSMVVMADIGVVSESIAFEVTSWVEKGGVLVRFAGPRMAAAVDDLVPVTLREGGRELGSSLSWESPQTMQAFADKTPFAGLSIDERATVRQQVLAEPDTELAQRTWASLADGTPLVTAARRGKGLIVLFHVTANPEWSTLPVTGLFVEMLKRITDLAPPAGSAAAANAVGTVEAQSYAPRLVLSGNGDLVTPDGVARPIAVADFDKAIPTRATPAGLYARGGSERAINLKITEADLKPLGALPSGAVLDDFAPPERTPLTPWVFLAAFLLFLGDILAALFLGGGLSRLRPAAAAAAIALATMLVVSPDDAQAQENKDELAMQAALQTHLAFVRTGNSEIDDTSEAGLKGLGLIVNDRTSVSLADPVGVNIESDDIVFYPMLYWPVDPDAQAPSPAAVSKIDTYMKKGGTIFFDLRDDGLSAGSLGDGTSPASEALQRILGKLDIPPLETVAERHVLTRSFYLLDRFPGRYEQGPLWVEAGNSGATNDPGTADGVSAIIIGSNDYAAAWALDDRGDPLYAVIPGSERQREFAFRTGVNIVMYALTGNYKADQVHIPALLERLGQ
jgi:hypothetical protein